MTKPIQACQYLGCSEFGVSESTSGHWCCAKHIALDGVLSEETEGEGAPRRWLVAEAQEEDALEY